MSDNTLWFGFLEAGDKSSPVVRDSRISTDNASTFYLFNHKRGEIIEYKAAIAEPKLRELKGDEQELIAELRNAYRKARNSFTPRGSRVANVPEKGRPAKASKAAALPVEEDFGGDDYADDEPDLDDSEDND